MWTSRVEHVGDRVLAASTRIGPCEPAALGLQARVCGWVQGGPACHPPPQPCSAWGYPHPRAPSPSHLWGLFEPHRRPLSSAADDSLCLSVLLPLGTAPVLQPGLLGLEPTGNHRPGWGCLRPGRIVVRAVSLSGHGVTVSQRDGGRVPGTSQCHQAVKGGSWVQTEARPSAGMDTGGQSCPARTPPKPHQPLPTLAWSCRNGGGETGRHGGHQARA